MSELWSAAQLAVFARVVELNGFSSAARAYGVPKVAISRAIADLEKSIGLQLMRRTTRRIFLTAAGDAVLPHARVIGIEVEKVRQLAQTFSTSRGTLRVIADQAYGRCCWRRWFRDFSTASGHRARRSPGSGEGADWDVAIRAGANEIEAGRGSRRAPAVLCALRTLSSIGTERPGAARSRRRSPPRVKARNTADDRALGTRRGRCVPSSRWTTRQLHSATVAGLGIGLLPEFLCRQGVATAKLRRVLADWQAPSAAPLYAVFPAGLENDHRVRSFVDFAAANIVPALAQ
jgi:DNA-binding transcriptional LysR family regulator